MIQNRTSDILPTDIIAFSTFRNENLRLPHFLSYYRDRGVNHFIMVDNESDDGGAEYLAQQTDVTLVRAQGSYKRARFGMDWINYLLRRYGRGHWCLTVDPDELLVYPYSDLRPIRALTDWLDTSSIKAFGAMQLDMYPKGPIDDAIYERGADPLKVLEWFDSGNYSLKPNARFRNLWIQGGPRARQFFTDKPERAPALNKIPLVKWEKHYAYVSSTHMLLPRGLNLVYEEGPGEKACGLLLHTKFLNNFGEKAREEVARQQHFANSHEYKAYMSRQSPDLWCEWSEKYQNWRQLEVLGLMSRGNWA